MQSHCGFHFTPTLLIQDCMQSRVINMWPFKVLHWLSPPPPPNPQIPNAEKFAKSPSLIEKEIWAQNLQNLISLDPLKIEIPGCSLFFPSVMILSGKPPRQDHIRLIKWNGTNVDNNASYSLMEWFTPIVMFRLMAFPRPFIHQLVHWKN